MSVYCGSIASSMSEYSFMDVSVKQEASLQLEQGSEYDGENFDNASQYSASTIPITMPNLLSPLEIPTRNAGEKVQKKEEKPVVHRNTGKISIENYRRRQRIRSICKTAMLMIEPVLEEESDRILVSTQTTMTQPNVIELSDGEHEEHEQQMTEQSQPQQVQTPLSPQQMETPLSPQQMATPLQQLPNQTRQLPQSVLNAIFSSVPQTINDLDRYDKSIYCDICDQHYVNRASLRKHIQTIKHQTNLQRQSQNSIDGHQLNIPHQA